MKSILNIIFGIALFLVGQGALAQRTVSPYIFAGPVLNGGLGYSPLGFVGGAGVQVEARRFRFDARGHYDFSRKTNDGTGQNNGFLFGGEGLGYYRKGERWSFGGGASWSELSTRLYTKKSWHPIAAASYDWALVRGEVRYVLPGTDKLNAVQGPEVVLTIPPPTSESHFFYQQTFRTLIFHNVGQTSHTLGSDIGFLLGYRF